MKRIALRTVAAIAVVIASGATTVSVADAGTAKRPKAPSSTCEQECPGATAPAAARGIRW